MIRVAFFGLPLAAWLLHRDGVDVAFAVLSPVDAPGRRRLGRALPGRVVDACATTSLEAEVDRLFSHASPDLIVSWYWTRLLPDRWLALPRLGGIGVHPSLLPRHRGPDPFFWAIDSADGETGVTVHRLTARYDEGDVLLRERLVIGDRNAWQLARALDRPSLRLLRRIVGDMARGIEPEGVPQDDALATWAPVPEGDLLRVDWNSRTERVLCRIRALSPVPGVPLEIRGTRFLVVAARRATEFPAALAPGEAGRTHAGVVIRTLDGAVLLEAAHLGDADALGDGGPRVLAARIAEAVFP